MSPIHIKEKVIALGERLKGCRNVLTLGVRPNFSDYSRQERDMIRAAAKIYYPTAFYADLFNAAGKITFPSYHTYKCVQDKIKQTALLELLEISHPRTRTFYGKRQKSKIRDYFDFPFIAKVARGSAMGRGVFLIQNEQELAAYCRSVATAYVQEYLPIDRDMRLVVIGGKVVHSYWRIAKPGEFRNNVAAGATIALEAVPSEALSLALACARRCGWDDVGIDICCCRGRYYVLEANMRYGRAGFQAAGIDYVQLMEELIEKGEI